MAAVSSILVVGGGSAGNATALLFRRAGVAVDLVDIDPEWNTLGSGITLCGNAFRALDQVGVWDEVKNEIEAPPAEFDLFKMGGQNYPGVAGMYRPRLQRILTDAVSASGATVRLGSTVSNLEEINDKVHVVFTDGTEGMYDLVVAADGINSAMRTMLGFTARPRRIGLSIWRVYGERPPGAVIGIRHGGKYVITGMNSTSKTHMYSYVVERTREDDMVRSLDKIEEIHRIGATLDDPYRSAFLAVSDASQVDYRPFHEFYLGLDCYRGRTVVIGDAAHVCPPTLAQGAAMALEDAVVLAEMVLGADKVDDTLLSAYAERRHARVSQIVNWSVELCDKFQDPDEAEQAFLESFDYVTPLVAELP